MDAATRSRADNGRPYARTRMAGGGAVEAMNLLAIATISADQ